MRRSRSMIRSTTSARSTFITELGCGSPETNAARPRARRTDFQVWRAYGLDAGAAGFAAGAAAGLAAGFAADVTTAGVAAGAAAEAAAALAAATSMSCLLPERMPGRA